MSVGEGPQAEGGEAGLTGLALRLVVGALLIVAAIVVTQQWGAGERAARERFTPSAGTVRLPELTNPVEILRDARGVPHVIAKAEADGWFALGFAHAQDRLAQMEFLRRRAAGRSAEIEGREALRWDKLARLLEIQRAAVRTVEDLPEASRAVLDAYAAGVNARIRRIRQGRVQPPQGLASDFDRVGDWRPADSIAVVKLLSWCIGGTLETTLVLDDLIQRLDSVPARPFFPGRASVDFGVAPEVPRHSVPSMTVEGPLADAVMGSTRGLCEGIGFPTGGAWVLSGAKTESRKPAVVADWHFAPSVPGLFYQAHVDAGGLDLAGATVPGSPIFWVGRTPEFAWAGVPASAPVSDLFIETLRERRGLYQNGTLWVPIEEREEVLRYRDTGGELAEETIHLRSTRHGPLIDSLWRDPAERLPATDAPSTHRAARALAWTGAREGDGLTSMLALARATSATEVQAILETHHEPVLAFAYADRAGGGGVQVAGWLPSRPLPTGLVPVQGRLRSFDWREPVVIGSLPGQTIGRRGRQWVLALDQPWPGRGGLDQTEWLWRPGDRAMRLELALDERLARGRLDLRGAADLLADAEAPRSPRVVTAIVGLARLGGDLPVEAEEIAGLLERWDGRLAADSAGAAAYHLVIEHLLERLLAAPLGEGLFERYLEAPHVRPQSAVERLVLRAAKLRQPGGWTDEAEVIAAARASLRDAWVSLNHRLGPTRERWAWGELHRMPLRRLGETSRVLRRLPVSGSGQTLAYTRHRPGVSFEVERAALYRVAIDLGAADRFLSSLAPGQSEHVGHEHEADGLGPWRRGDLALFATSRLVIEEENAERLLLEPAP